MISMFKRGVHELVSDGTLTLANAFEDVYRVLDYAEELDPIVFNWIQSHPGISFY